jgi:hypothetical protein
LGCLLSHPSLREGWGTPKSVSRRVGDGWLGSVLSHPSLREGWGTESYGAPKVVAGRQRKKNRRRESVPAAIGFWLQPYLLSAYYI